jgi:hypothetical protein
VLHHSREMDGYESRAGCPKQTGFSACYVIFNQVFRGCILVAEAGFKSG